MLVNTIIFYIEHGMVENLEIQITQRYHFFLIFFLFQKKGKIFYLRANIIQKLIMIL